MWLDLLSAFLQKLMEIVLPVLATALAGLAIAWITKVVGDIKSRISSDAEWYIGKAIEAAVFAAEQIGLKQIALDKKEFAIQFAQAQLDARGIKIDLTILSGLIEAAVMREFNMDKPSGDEMVAGTD